MNDYDEPISTPESEEIGDRSFVPPGYWGDLQAVFRTLPEMDDAVIDIEPFV